MKMIVGGNENGNFVGHDIVFPSISVLVLFLVGIVATRRNKLRNLWESKGKLFNLIRKSCWFRASNSSVRTERPADNPGTLKRVTEIIKHTNDLILWTRSPTSDPCFLTRISPTLGQAVSIRRRCRRRNDRTWPRTRRHGRSGVATVLNGILSFVHAAWAVWRGAENKKKTVRARTNASGHRSRVGGVKSNLMETGLKPSRAEEAPSRKWKRF